MNPFKIKRRTLKSGSLETGEGLFKEQFLDVEEITMANYHLFLLFIIRIYYLCLFMLK